MSHITTHVLDTASGIPAPGITVSLYRYTNDVWHLLGSEITDADGRVKRLLPDDYQPETGSYKLTFLLEPYFKTQALPCFYPEASIVFIVSDHSHYHIPLLLSPYGYTTYRGS